MVSVFEAYDERYEAENVLEQIHQLRSQQDLDFRDFAVMYRTNAQSRALERAFVDATVPYMLIGGVGFYKRREVKDLLAYLRLIHTPTIASASSASSMCLRAASARSRWPPFSIG